jgi:hypothetical protein
MNPSKVSGYPIFAVTLVSFARNSEHQMGKEVFLSSTTESKIKSFFQLWIELKFNIGIVVGVVSSPASAVVGV